MVATIYAGFNTARIGTLSCTLTDIPVPGGATVTIPAGKYCDVDLSSVMGASTYTAIAAATETALLAASPTADYDVQFSTSTRLFTIGNAGSAFQLDFTSTAGQRLAKVLGITASNTYGSGSGYACVVDVPDSQSLTSDVLPYYLVPLARDEPARYSRPYEMTGAVKRKVTTNGNSVGVQPLTLPEFVDFQTLFMPLANVHSSEATAAQPWTVKHAVQHCRATEPLCFYFASSGHLVCKLTESSAAFTKEMRQVSFSQAADYHGLWHISWDALQYLGAI